MRAFLLLIGVLIAIPVCLFLYGLVRRGVRSVRNQHPSATRNSGKIPPMTNERFAAFTAWIGVWAMQAPQVPKLRPVIIAEKVELFVRAIFDERFEDADSMLDSVGPPEVDTENATLILFYFSKLLPSFEEFDKSMPGKDELKSLVSTGAEVGSRIFTLHALVQTLYWQAWYCKKFASTPVSIQKAKMAMEVNYEKFLEAAQFLDDHIDLFVKRHAKMKKQ